jgi:ribokinase
MSSSPRVGVVGHVEWVEFAVVERLPLAGEIVHAREWFTEACGGGGVAAVQMTRLLGEAPFFTVVGSDAAGEAAADRLRALGVTLHAAVLDGPQRRGFTYLTDDHERTITILGERMVPSGADPIPWELVRELDGVYVTGGDAAAIRAARAARVVVATPRAAPGLVEAGIELDAVVMSATDVHEQGIAERLDPPPRLVVRTQGATGGEWRAIEGRTGAWQAVSPPGEPVDSFGCGDSFAAGLTMALAAGLDVDRALAYAARLGAAVLTGRGPYGARIEEIGPPR